MSPARRKPAQNRRGGQKARAKNPANELWRPVPQLEPPDPIRPSSDPGAVLRSLGDPPLQGQGAVAEHYIAAVAERAALMAGALAATAGLLAPAATDED